jgi:hypothetical protein
MDDIWHHVTRELMPDGKYKQVCKYCARSKNYVQQQSTFWATHIADVSQCQNASMAIRRAIASKSMSKKLKGAVAQQGMEDFFEAALFDNIEDEREQAEADNRLAAYTGDIDRDDDDDSD